ncbi:UvrD-helicase domain-containing protein [Sporosarcina sp. GW1-11]|uniref:UvrD-helicase domain-containing protein n=1 Tax=Sporosarcina sp. GW1-11 TaxID=2899126 RepID=UPI00294D4622|nr:UvrD-helicase domain-containing protein [Sporosarcina sp. GW1-11]MDV6376971.1 UvrD-helicase domain-containing protein [Sporosarcina sp. GW1-11]
MKALRNDRRERLENFGSVFSKKWKNYFDLEGLIPGIEPTNEQAHVVQSSEKQLIIRGSAGSGKSLMLAYRLIKIMEQADSGKRILYVTFNQVLIDDTIKRLNQSEKYKELSKKHSVEIVTYHNLVQDILTKSCGFSEMKRLYVTQASIEKHEDDIIGKIEIVLHHFRNSKEYHTLEKLFKTHTARFLQEEFFWMKANGLITEEKYLENERTGRGINPSVRMKQRSTIFHLFQKYNEFMKNNYSEIRLDMEDYALYLLNEMAIRPNVAFRYDHILVDEFQDLQPMQIKSLVLLAKSTITLVGDDKQRIYKRSPLPYKELQLKLNPRTNHRLTKNFRSTKQIMDFAGSLKFLDTENVRDDDQDFFREGIKPQIIHFSSMERLATKMIAEIKNIHQKKPHKTIAVIHRYTENELRQEENIRFRLNREFDVVDIKKYGRKYNYNSVKKPIFFTTPYEIKGLEFDYVFIMHFDKEHYPLKLKVEELNEKYNGRQIGDLHYDKDYDLIENEEKKLLYVACSRAKDELHIYYVALKTRGISPFIRGIDTVLYDCNFKKTPYK